ALLPQLAARGYSITALVHRQAPVDGCQTILGALEDVAKISRDIAECDAIVHLACSGSAQEKEVLEQDIAGGARLIQAWTKGVFIYASTSALYALQQGPVTECAPIMPNNWHTFGKHAVELQLRLAERQKGRGGAALLRPALVFPAPASVAGTAPAPG